MAKYVLLRFDDDSDADRFVANYQQLAIFQAIDVIEGQHYGYEYVGVRSRSTVRAVYKCPTLFHESSECRGDTTFARGPKYGWMVCTRCGKPTRAWAEGDGWYTSLGTNMLPVTEEAGEYRGYGVPGHYWDKEKRAYVPYGRSHPLMGGQAGFASKEEGIATGLIKDGQ